MTALEGLLVAGGSALALLGGVATAQYGLQPLHGEPMPEATTVATAVLPPAPIEPPDLTRASDESNVRPEDVPAPGRASEVDPPAHDEEAVSDEPGPTPIAEDAPAPPSSSAADPGDAAGAPPPPDPPGDLDPQR